MQGKKYAGVVEASLCWHGHFNAVPISELSQDEPHEFVILMMAAPGVLNGAVCRIDSTRAVNQSEPQPNAPLIGLG